MSVICSRFVADMICKCRFQVWVEKCLHALCLFNWTYETSDLFPQHSLLSFSEQITMSAQSQCKVFVGTVSFLMRHSGTVDGVITHTIKSTTSEYPCLRYTGLTVNVCWSLNLSLTLWKSKHSVKLHKYMSTVQYTCFNQSNFSSLNFTCGGIESLTPG